MYDPSDTIKEEFDKARTYWEGKFSAEANEIDLCRDFERSLDYKRGRRELEFEQELSTALLSLSKNRDFLLYIVLLAALKVLIFKYTGNQDISIGAPVYSNEIEISAGNRLIIFRDILDETVSFKELMIQVKQTVIEGYEYQHYVMEDMLEVFGINIPRLLLARIILLLENIHRPQFVDEIIDSPANDLTISLTRTRYRLKGYIDYNSKLFKEGTIAGIVEHYFHILEQVLHDITIKLSDITLLSYEEKKKIIYHFNETKTVSPAAGTIHHLFAGQVERTPHHRAVAFCDQTLVYGELHCRANRLAGILCSNGVSRGTIVGLMLTSSLHLIEAVLGILISGGVYLPIDPGIPEPRKKVILEDSRLNTIIVRQDIFERNKDLLETISIDNIIIIDDTNIASGTVQNRKIECKPEDAAYIIFTSGTTGKPKGVLVEHKGIVNYTSWRLKTYQYTEKDVTLQLLSYSFDGYNSNLYSSLVSGGTLIEIPDARKLDFPYIKETVGRESVTNMSIVPKIYELFLDNVSKDDLRSLRFVVLAGETVRKGLIRKSKEKKAGLKLINEYGPTETTVTASYNPDMDETNSAVIGKPISNTALYILDHSFEPVPIGVPAELFISGIGVSRGCLNNQWLTNEKFVPNPFITGERMYKSGDKARWLSGGWLEFIGRVDRQVKVRGFRIEPEEIECLMLEMDHITEAVVIDKEKDGEKYLCAYFVSEKGITAADIRSFLSKRIPDYMIPSYFMSLEQIPLSVNGKVNSKLLPGPELKPTVEYIAPRNEVEEKLVGLWADILDVGKERISIDANFFELGGHSLKVTILAASIHKVFDVNLAISRIFEIPTIREISGYIKEAEIKKYAAIKPVEKKECYPLSSAQKRLYFLQQMEPGSTTYNIFSVLPLGKNINIERFELTFREILSRHESLRTSFDMLGRTPIQKIHSASDLGFVFEYNSVQRRVGDSGGLSAVPGLDVIQEQFVRPFDMTKAPLLRCRLLELAGGENILLLDLHHIICDGISINTVIEDFKSLYKGEKLSPLQLQYKDYSQWQHSKEQKESIKKQEKYWLKEFAGNLPILDLPTDYKRPAVLSFSGDQLEFYIDAGQTKALNDLARSQNMTLHMTLLTILYILLYKYTNQDDIIIGTITSGRRHADLQKIVGMFINTLMQRNYPKPGKTFVDFLIEVKENTINTFENQDYPFETLVERLGVERSINRNPIFDVVFTLQNQFESAAAYEDESQHLEEYGQGYKRNISHFDLVLTGGEVGDKIYLIFEYCSKLFKQKTIEKMIKDFKDIIGIVINDNYVRLKDIELEVDLLPLKKAALDKIELNI